MFVNCIICNIIEVTIRIVYLLNLIMNPEFILSNYQQVRSLDNKQRTFLYSAKDGQLPDIIIKVATKDEIRGHRMINHLLDEDPTLPFIRTLGFFSLSELNIEAPSRTTCFNNQECLVMPRVKGICLMDLMKENLPQLDFIHIIHEVFKALPKRWNLPTDKFEHVIEDMQKYHIEVGSHQMFAWLEPTWSGDVIIDWDSQNRKAKQVTFIDYSYDVDHATTPNELYLNFLECELDFCDEDSNETYINFVNGLVQHCTNNEFTYNQVLDYLQQMLKHN